MQRVSYFCIALLFLWVSSGFAQEQLRVGFIEGRGEDAAVEAQALESAEVQYEVIGAADYNLDRLKNFDVIGVGVVAYDQNEELIANYKVVKDYITSGGYLVTLDFQQDSTWDKGFLPHPLELFDDDLNEDAGVEIMDHPMWHTPNEITMEHFIGWGAEDFMADGPHEANPPWQPLLISGGWTIVVGADAGDGYVVFSSLQTLQALGRTGNEKIKEVMQNMLFWHGPLAVEASDKLATTWGDIRREVEL